MSDRRPVEVFAAFVKVSGHLEMVRPHRLTDSVNRGGEFLHLHDAEVQPLAPGCPVLSSAGSLTTVARSEAILICPLGEGREGNPTMWREKQRQPVAITTFAYSLVGDVHLEPRHTLQDQLERFRGDFIPITAVSALWIAAIGTQTQAVQRPFALLNPAAILSFSLRAPQE